MENNKLSHAISSIVLCSLAGGMASTPLLAADSLALEEVLVTARKRTESLQEIPIAITAFSSADIESAGIRNVTDVANLTAGFNMAPLFGGEAATPVIRGLSTTIGEPNVGFFVDGVYMGSRLTMNRLLGDFVERIEVAKGPQTALYGRNTFGGAVNFVTKRPSDEFEGDIEATVGDNGKQELRATFGGPIGQSGFGYRVGVLYDEFDGYYENELTGDDLDSQETTGVLGALSWAGDKLSADLNVMYSEEDNGDLALRFVDNNSIFTSAFGLPPNFQIYTGALPNFDDGYAVTPGGMDRDQTFSSLKIDWDLGAITLSSITGYNDFSHDRDADDDYSAADVHYTKTGNDITEISQELRLTSNTENNLQWMVGLYYYDLDNERDTNAAYSAPFNTFNPRLNGNGNITKQTTEDYAVFGSLDWFITDTFTLGVSGRYGDEEKDVDATDTNLTTGAIGTFKDNDSWNSFQPRVSLDWQFSDYHMAYASYAKAIKSGGFNVVTATGAILPDERFYDEENSDNYEIGIKSEFADGRVLSTLAAYYIEWDDQIVRAIGATGAILNANAGKSTSMGVEFELQAQVTEHLDVRLGVAYNDSSYDDYFFAILADLGLDPVLDGETLQYAPEWTGNISVGYTLPVFGDWEWFSRVDSNYTDEQNAIQTGHAVIDSVTLTNLRTGLGNDNWRVTLWVYNLTDEKYNSSAAFVGDPSALTGVFLGNGFSAFQGLVTAGDEQSYGATIKYSF